MVNLGSSPGATATHLAGGDGLGCGGCASEELNNEVIYSSRVWGRWLTFGPYRVMRVGKRWSRDKGNRPTVGKNVQTAKIIEPATPLHGSYSSNCGLRSWHVQQLSQSLEKSKGSPRAKQKTAVGSVCPVGGHRSTEQPEVVPTEGPRAYSTSENAGNQALVRQAFSTRLSPAYS